MYKLKELRKQRGLTQQELAEFLGISKQGYSNYELGKRKPNVWTLEKLAGFYGVPLEDLLDSPGTDSAIRRAVRIPVLGSVPAGIPIEAIEDIIDWEEIPQRMTAGGKKFFALKVEGDSMYPKYLHGDIIIVLYQPCCNNRDDCIVYVNGYNATLKTVIYNNDGTLTLQPLNPEYSPRTFSKAELEKGIVAIAGVVVELRRKIT